MSLKNNLTHDCKRNGKSATIKIGSTWKHAMIDSCMFDCIAKVADAKYHWPVACCCGHGIYHKTIVIETKKGTHYELYSDVMIPRKRNYYKKNKDGFYYIPEVEAHYAK